MKERIKQLRKDELNYSQQKFAEKINLKQNTIAQYEAGTAQPTDRVIADICREFNTNEDWLRTGEGSIFREMTEKEEIIFKINKALEGKSDSLIHGMYFLTELDAEEIKLMENIAYQIIEHTRSREFIKRINEKK